MIAYKKTLGLILLTLFLGMYPWSSDSIQAKSPHGIILISLDTLRADHLGCYGYHRNTSPSIDAFAKESVVFENAVAHSPWTLPSHMSIMTSLYPSFHGIHEYDDCLADEHVTLAELLRQGGYQTAAFTDGGFVSAKYGFNQGFDIYEDQRIGIMNILPKVKKWLDVHSSQPFFLFIHCYDIHGPYNPPPPYNSIFHDFTYTGHLVPSNRNLKEARWKRLKVNDKDLQHFIALYDGGIRYADDKIGEFLSYLQDVGLEEQSLIIITSDHGEEFKDHGSFHHWQLYYRPNLHIPLIMRIPAYARKRIRIDKLVSSIDLLPTILDIAELSAHPKAQGKSLLPLIKHRKNFSNSSVTLPFRKDRDISFAEETRINQWSIITDDYQMINNVKSSFTQLFNLEVDPLAKNNIAKDHPDITEQLFSQWQKVFSKTSHYKSLAIDLDQQTLDQLKELGYIDTPKKTSITKDDYDNDGVLNDADNCHLKTNPKQEDADGDGVGDVCDNCSNIANSDQENIDEDWIGDACDECVDTDWDGYGNPGFSNACDEDNCPNIFNPDQKDTYPAGGNGCGDVCDCIGNFDRDEEVDSRDSAIFYKHFGRKDCTQKNPCKGDFDCDGDVDDKDFMVLKENIGRNGCAPCAFLCSY